MPLNDATATRDRRIGRRPAPVMRIEVSTATILKLLAAIAGVWIIIRLLPVVLVLVVALMIVGAMGPTVERLQKLGIGRPYGIAMMFAVLFGVIGILGVLILPDLFGQLRTLLDMEPTVRGRIAAWLSHSRITAGLADSLRNVHYDTLIKSSSATVLDYSTRFLEDVAYGVGAVFLALYIMLDRDRLRGALFAVVPRSHHIRLSRILVNLQTIVGGYIRGQVITCSMMAAFMFILLTACGIPNALAIAVFGGLADVLPYVGIFLTMAPAVAAALPYGVVITLVVLTLMLVYEEFESRVWVPFIYGRALRLPTSVVLFSLIAGATLLGIIGALLALPVAAAILMLIDELRVELPGETDRAEDVETRRLDERGEREYERRTEGMPAQEAAAIAVKIAGDAKKAKDKAEKSGETAKAGAPAPVTQDTQDTQDMLTGESTAIPPAA